jgi:hypothetical protein
MKTKNLYIGFENSAEMDSANNSVRAIVYYKGFPLFNIWKWKKDTDWPGKADKWELNRSDIAIKNNYYPSENLFDSLVDILDFLEEEFCENWYPILPNIR